MEIEWIEDFLSLADARSFSRAASSRHSSQPAFSRRIQALESWLGVDLIDRSVSPPKLTPAGHAFRGFAKNTVRQLYQARNLLQGNEQIPATQLRFAVAHTLSLTFFPAWFVELRKSLDSPLARVREMNVMEGATALVAGKVDFLICYHHPHIPILLDIDQHPSLALGSESFRPYSACDENGRAIYRLPGQPDTPLPFLSYATGTFLVHVVDMILLNAPRYYVLEQCYQCQMSEAIKAMVLTAAGVGWLPEKCVEKEVTEGKMAVADDGDWSARLEIRIYGSARNRQPTAEKLWNLLHK